MYEIIRELETKQGEAQDVRDELEGFQYDLVESIKELDNYIDEAQNLIDSLSNLPSVSVNVNVRVEFAA